MSYTDDAIAAAVALSVQHIPDRNLPDKALDLLDEAGSRARIAAYTARAAQPDTQHADRHLELSQARHPSLTCMHMPLPPRCSHLRACTPIAVRSASPGSL